MEIAVFDWGEVSEPDEEAEEDAVDDNVMPKLVAEGYGDDGEAYAEDRDEGGESIAELQLLDVRERHAEVEDEDGDEQQRCHFVGGDLVVA